MDLCSAEPSSTVLEIEMFAATLAFTAAIGLGGPLLQQEAQSWRLAAADAVELTSIDAHNVVREGDKRLFNVLTVRVEPELGWDYSLTRWEIDCRTHNLRFLSGASYSVDHRALERSDSPVDMGRISAGTGGEIWEDAVCEDAWRSTITNTTVPSQVAAMKGLRPK